MIVQDPMTCAPVALREAGETLDTARGSRGRWIEFCRRPWALLHADPPVSPARPVCPSPTRTGPGKTGPVPGTSGLARQASPEAQLAVRTDGESEGR